LDTNRVGGRKEILRVGMGRRNGTTGGEQDERETKFQNLVTELRIIGGKTGSRG